VGFTSREGSVREVVSAAEFLLFTRHTYSSQRLVKLWEHANQQSLEHVKQVVASQRNQLNSPRFSLIVVSDCPSCASSGGDYRVRGLGSGGFWGFGS
jgi:hypothetical protein